MNWSLIAHRSELAQPGDYVLLSSGVDQTLAYNNAGSILISNNVCRHRGSRVFSGTHGNAPLKCPYHGFEGDKALKAEGLTAWVGDWLFAGSGLTRLEDDLGEAKPLLEGISEKIANRHAFDMMPMPCDWSVAVENTLEDLHVPSVHPDTFGKLKLEHVANEKYGKNSIAYYKVGDERTVRGLTAMSRSFKNVQPDTYFHLLLYPYTCISSLGGFTFSVQQYLPNGSFTALHTRLYAGKTRDDAPNLGYFFEEAAQFNRLVFQQDSAACARVAGRGTYLTQAEQRVAWFREAA